MKNKKVLFSILMMISLSSLAQVEQENCIEAKEFFESFTGECKRSFFANNCIHLDITDSYDFEGKELLFYWDMGDETRLEGMEVNHCYERSGHYLAVLSLFDPITQFSVAEEFTVEVVIEPEFDLSITNVSDGVIGDSLSFSYQVDYPENEYKLESVYWYFGDETFSCQNTPHHVYTSTGVFEANVIMLMSSASHQKWLCDSDTVRIKMKPPDAHLLTGIFDSIQIASRFLADEVHYQVLSNDEDILEPVTDLSSLTSGVGYKLLVFSGNIIFNLPEIKIESNVSSRLILDSINSLAKTIINEEPLNFRAVFFDSDQDDLTKKNKKKIKENISLLNDFPTIELLIGVYTTSSGALVKGSNYSMRRAQLIKDYMMENGIGENRIHIADPNSYRSLINSCVTGNNCDYVDLTLDRRADFKILTQ